MFLPLAKHRFVLCCIYKEQTLCNSDVCSNKQKFTHHLWFLLFLSDYPVWIIYMFVVVMDYLY